MHNVDWISKNRASSRIRESGGKRKDKKEKRKKNTEALAQF
jgi:hypothetical protein